MYLLKQINSYLGKREIPKEVIHRMFRIVHSGKLGKKGFLVLCLNKIEDDYYGIEEAVGMYPGRMWLDENMGTIEVKKWLPEESRLVHSLCESKRPEDLCSLSTKGTA